MRIDVTGGIGDVIAATAAVREYKRQHPDELVRIGDSTSPEVWLHNPHLNWGATDNGKQIELRMDAGRSDKGGNAAHAHAAQLGIQLVDDCPELFLTDEERAATKFERLVSPPSGGPRVLETFDAVVTRPEKTIAVDCGAGWLSKRWPFARWQELCRKLLAAGYDVYEVGKFISGAGRSGPLPSTRSYLDKTDVRQCAVMLSRCALFLGQESGLMHLAASVGTPQVIVYGHTKFADYGYYNAVPVQPYSSCGENCYQQCYREPKVRGVFSHCMDEISVGRVFDAVELALRRFPYLPWTTRPETRVGVPRREVIHRCGGCGGAR